MDLPHPCIINGSHLKLIRLSQRKMIKEALGHIEVSLWVLKIFSLFFSSPLVTFRNVSTVVGMELWKRWKFSQHLSNYTVAASDTPKRVHDHLQSVTKILKAINSFPLHRHSSSQGSQSSGYSGEALVQLQLSVQPPHQRLNSPLAFKSKFRWWNQPKYNTAQKDNEGAAKKPLKKTSGKALKGQWVRTAMSNM